MLRPYTAADICTALGITPDTLYRTRAKLHARGMPQPFLCRPLRWERSGFDAWLTRHHPARPQGMAAPANDTAATPSPASIEESRARLAQAYGRS
jgi:predicted DNA-binding transcriptional regulator AlpA